METFDTIKKRYSYRGSYKSTPVPREDLKKILKAGLAAPSGCNTQSTSLIGIDDPELIGSIVATVNKDSIKSKGAPAGVIVLTQRIPGNRNIFYNVQDYAAAIQNVLLAIADLGYVSCWIEGQVTSNPEVQKEISKMLNIPADYAVVAFLPIGIPEKDGKRPNYKTFSERAWFNHFGKSE